VPCTSRARAMHLLAFPPHPHRSLQRSTHQGWAASPLALHECQASVGVPSLTEYERSGQQITRGHYDFQDHRAHCRPSPCRASCAASEHSGTHLAPSSGAQPTGTPPRAGLRPRLDRRGGTRTATPNGVLRIHQELGAEPERSRPPPLDACATAHRLVYPLASD
jgi:hypothetical protein